MFPGNDAQLDTLGAEADAISFLSTAPPEISPDQAIAVAQSQFGLEGPVSPLSGERDRNFLVQIPGGGRAVLKFVNSAESLSETQLQVAVLRHLRARGTLAMTPQALLTCAGTDLGEWHDGAANTLKVRAYGFLEGRPAMMVAGSARLRRSLGRALGSLDAALADFEHVGTQRVFLWDLMQLTELRAFLRFVGDGELRALASDFLEVFASGIQPALKTLRMQVIHNDLSKSNFIVSAHDDGEVAGILDFGDVGYAPLVCDLAIAASYQMSDAADPLSALDEVAEGFESVQPLLPEEREHLLDLVVARVVQRLVITEWRASQFAVNREYILRHNPEARSLLTRLMPLWRQRSQHARRRISVAGLVSGLEAPTS